MKHTFIFLSLLIIICSCESPLSEQAVSDPNLIQPIIQVLKETDYKGTTYYRYRCDIYDKFLRKVELKDGSVKVNGENMIVITDVLGTYYLQDDSRIKYGLNMKYNFTVTLSDQTQYNASVTTHTDSIRDFIVPSEHDTIQNIVVSWKGNEAKSSMYISVTSYYRTDTTQGFNFHNVQIPNPGLGVFELPPSKFIYKEGKTYSVDLTLNSEIEGTIDNRFYVNRRAFSHQMITKSVTIK